MRHLRLNYCAVTLLWTMTTHGIPMIPVFIHSHCVPVFAIDILSDVTIGDVRKTLTKMQTFGQYPLLEFGGKRLQNDALCIADIGICQESVIEVIGQHNDLQLFDAAIANTESQTDAWFVLTHGNFSNYQQFAEHHNQNYTAMVQAMQVCWQFILSFSDGDITHICFSELDFDYKLDLSGTDVLPLSGMKALISLELIGAQLSNHDLSALPSLTSLRRLSVAYNPQLQYLNVPNRMELQRLDICGCGIVELDCTNLNGSLIILVCKQLKTINGTGIQLIDLRV